MIFIAREQIQQHGRTETATVQAPDTAGADYRLGELRKRSGVTQMELAGLMGIGQPRVSAIERGDIDTLTVASLRAYIEGLGGTIRVVARVGGADITLRLPAGQ